MKKGICLTAVYPQAMYDSGLLKELLEKTAVQGIFNCVDFYFEGKAGEEEEIRKLLEKRNLCSVFLAGFPMKRDGVDITSPDERVRRKSVEFCRRMYERCQGLGAGKMLIVSGPAWKEKDGRALMGQACKSFEEIGTGIGGNGPEITLEFFNDEGEPELAVGKVPFVRKLYEQTQGCGIGITFDTSHVAQMGADVETSFASLAPWIRHLHLANSVSVNRSNPLFGDKHPLFGVRDGDFTVADIRKHFCALKEQNMLRNVDICSLEVISRGDNDWYYDRISEQAAEIWKGERIL